jgi:hypothetical protein
LEFVEMSSFSPNSGFVSGELIENGMRAPTAVVCAWPANVIRGGSAGAGAALTVRFTPPEAHDVPTEQTSSPIGWFDIVDVARTGTRNSSEW